MPRFLPLIATTLVIVACAPRPGEPARPHTPPPTTTATNPASVPTPPATPAAPTPPAKPATTPDSLQKLLPLAYHRTTSGGVRLAMVSFDSRTHKLRVADQPNGPGSRWPDAKSAAATYHGLAAVNAGFFTPEGTPLGLLIETGTRRGHINKSSSVGSGMFVASKTSSAIIRREQYRTSPVATNAYNLLQTGPMLVEAGRPVSGLSKTRLRPRSFLAWDGNHHWAIGYADAATLDSLAKALAGHSPAGFKIRTAINLDGGRSSDLWASPKVKNGNKSHRTFLNKTVRNYLILLPR